MDGTLDQLLRLLSNRGLEWLRQRIMALPDPCPVDHPDLDALAWAGQVAPVLSGFRSRLSPLEVIVQRRLTADLVAQGAARVLEGARDPALIRLMLAGGLVARDHPAWQLACEALAEDAALPLPDRLTLSADPAIAALAEDFVAAPPPERITRDHVARMTETVMRLFQHGARRPRLSHPRSFARIFDHLRTLADWAQAQGCTASVARVAFCLRLLDDDHPLSDMVADMIQVQRPDGSFPPRLRFGTDDQPMSQGIEATLAVAMALHMAAWRRWRGPAPVWLQPRPLRGAALLVAGRLGAMTPPPEMALRQATCLTRATGENWFARLGPPQAASPEDLGHLARTCFRDPVSARHLRAWLGLTRSIGAATCAERSEAAWIEGRAVTLRSRCPEALTAMWDKAARQDDEAAFLACARLALHHAEVPSTQAIRDMTRRIAGRAITTPADPAQLVPALERLVLLAEVMQPPQTDRIAA